MTQCAINALMQRGKQHQFAFPSSRGPTQWLYIVLGTVRISRGMSGALQLLFETVDGGMALNA
jgi:hypothetical protein